MRPLLRAIYRRYPHVFQDFLVEDLVGNIPKDVVEPSVAFLGRGKDVLTRFFLFQAYFVQRRSVSDVSNADRYHGMLIFIKYMLAIISENQPRETFESVMPQADTEKDPLIGVTAFAHGFKERRQARSDQDARS